MDLTFARYIFFLFCLCLVNSRRLLLLKGHLRGFHTPQIQQFWKSFVVIENCDIAIMTHNVSIGKDKIAHPISYDLLRSLFGDRLVQVQIIEEDQEIQRKISQKMSSFQTKHNTTLSPNRHYLHHIIVYLFMEKHFSLFQSYDSMVVGRTDIIFAFDDPQVPCPNIVPGHCENSLKFNLTSICIFSLYDSLKMRDEFRMQSANQKHLQTAGFSVSDYFLVAPPPDVFSLYSHLYHKYGTLILSRHASNKISGLASESQFYISRTTVIKLVDFRDISSLKFVSSVLRPGRICEVQHHSKSVSISRRKQHPKTRD